MHTSWTIQDIDALRKYYLEGKSFKEMARLLNRTPTAINKCLTRFQIRPRKRVEFYALPKQDLKTYGQTEGTNPTDLIDMVLSYAKTVLRMTIAELAEGAYVVDRHPMTFPQILLRVNQDRVLRNLSPYINV